MVPPVILLLPIFDTTLVTISRLRRGLNPFTTPGKDHVSHRITMHGFTRREAVMLCWLIAAASGMVAVFLTQAPVYGAYLVAVLIVLAAIYAIWRLEQADFGF
jgi:UDP-GlcNAc:undecaprenyl-phosphate GlcNAc-1-phosphate transferase